MKPLTVHRLIPPEEPKHFRFGIRSLLVSMVFVGPLALVATKLPIEVYVVQGILIFVVASLMAAAWGASFLRPGPLAICFLALALLSTVLVIALNVEGDHSTLVLRITTGVSWWATLTFACALGLSKSRYAK